jgi:hypothetical protein
MAAGAWSSEVSSMFGAKLPVTPSEETSEVQSAAASMRVSPDRDVVWRNACYSYISNKV